jgi:hypothetical protein
VGHLDFLRLRQQTDRTHLSEVQTEGVVGTGRIFTSGTLDLDSIVEVGIVNIGIIEDASALVFE